MSKSDYEARKAAMLEDIRAVMDDVEALYNKGVEEGSEEIEDLKTRLGDKLEAAKEKLSAFESDAAASLRKHSARAKKKFREFEEEAGDQIKRRAKQADEAAFSDGLSASRRKNGHQTRNRTYENTVEPRD